LDIWDKNTTSPKYVTWRLSNLALEVSRIRPDACLQRLIRTMRNGADWHENVKDMTIDYDSAWTEYDQIDRAGKAIRRISQDYYGTFEICDKMWEVMKVSDAIARSLSRKVRGHARHAINVFWLGYYLIYHDLLSPYFSEIGKKIINDTENKEISREEPLKAISSIWFYTGLFHDIGISVEKSKDYYKHQKTLIDMFETYALPLPDLKDYASKNFSDDVTKITDQFNSRLWNKIEVYFQKGFQNKSPDHGLVAATYLLEHVKSEKNACYAREAGRAIMLHQAIGEIGKEKEELISWEKEPISCLLLICDQLQTWDRERGDKSLNDDDLPDRAELLNLLVKRDNDKPLVDLYIDYIVQPHVLRYNDIYNRVKSFLESILFDKPIRSLNKIADSWPFKLKVNFSIGRDQFYDTTYGK